MNRLQLILLVLSTATFSPFVFSETLSPQPNMNFMDKSQNAIRVCLR